MGLLDQLWDDTLAGPRPENGLGRLRKHNTFTAGSRFIKDESMEGLKINTAVEGEEAPKVTRSIMIKRPAGCPSPVSGTPPSSPSTPPVSPFSSGE